MVCVWPGGPSFQSLSSPTSLACASSYRNWAPQLTLSLCIAPPAAAAGTAGQNGLLHSSIMPRGYIATCHVCVACWTMHNRHRQHRVLQGDFTPLLPARLQQTGERSVTVSLCEGRYHQVTIGCGAAGQRVRRARCVGSRGRGTSRIALLPRCWHSTSLLPLLARSWRACTPHPPLERPSLVGRTLACLPAPSRLPPRPRTSHRHHSHQAGSNSMLSVCCPCAWRCCTTVGRLQVRRMLAAVGHEVVVLRRVSIGGMPLGSLPSSEWRYVTPEELALVFEGPTTEDVLGAAAAAAGGTGGGGAATAVRGQQKQQQASSGSRAPAAAAASPSAEPSGEATAETAAAGSATASSAPAASASGRAAPEAQRAGGRRGRDGERGGGEGRAGGTGDDGDVEEAEVWEVYEGDEDAVVSSGSGELKVRKYKDGARWQRRRNALKQIVKQGGGVPASS